MNAKPVEAIERMRKDWRGNSMSSCEEDCRTILAWADSIPADAVCVVWPAHLTREFLLRLIDDLATSVDGPTMNLVRAIQDLAAIAPMRKKRVVNLWRHDGANINAYAEVEADDRMRIRDGWRKVGGPVEVSE